MARPTFDEGFSTSRLTDLFTPASTVASLLTFEIALARSLAAVGLAPHGEAEALVAACERGVRDPESILASTWDRGTPIMALREQVTSDLPDQVRRWFHFGATSQDAIDTSHMLQTREALEIHVDLLITSARRLRELTEEHRDLPHMGRTFLQDARIMTFGFRTATWLDTLLTHIAELRESRARLPAQLGGPVGTRDGLGDAGARVTAHLADQLGLVAPNISWHTNRSTILSIAQTVERAALSTAKIAADIAWLASSAVGEIHVRSGGSSSMPDKENPIDAIRAVASARVCSGAAAMLILAAPHELDRALGAWHVEWVALPMVFQAAGASMEAVATALDSLAVEPGIMRDRAGDGPPSRGEGAQIDGVLSRFDELIG